MDNSREIALLCIEEVLFNGAYSNITLNKKIKDNEAYNDENFIRELVYGSIENKLYLEYILRKLSKIRLKKIHSKIYSVLIMGIYQIYFMDKVPESAAVNESVKLAKKFGNKGSVGFVNGILRNILRNKDELGKIVVENDIKYISIKYSHPEWLVNNWIQEFGLDFTKELCKSNNEKSKFTIVYNRIKTTKENLKLKLINQGYNLEDSKISNDAILIKNPKKIFETIEFKDGLFMVQGEGSSLVSEIVNPKENTKVIDVCAAPGGKTIHMAEIMNNKGILIARDIYSHRLKLIDENIERLGINIIKTEKFDGTKLDNNLLNQIDYCLVDAPCSGLGTIRQSPEIKYNRTDEDILTLAKIQLEILNVSKNYIKTNGILVYSTCTIEKRENNDIIEAFLKENKNFKLDKEPIQLYPNIDDTDGFFVCRMKKVK